MKDIDGIIEVVPNNTKLIIKTVKDKEHGINYYELNNNDKLKFDIRKINGYSNIVLKVFIPKDKNFHFEVVFSDSMNVLYNFIVD